jgi:hypothetical protein
MLPARKQGESKAKPTVADIANWALLAAGSANLLIGTCYAGFGNVAVAGTSLTAGLILLFAATIDRFESLKGMGVEAKTRQLDKKIEEAGAALEDLRELAELVGESVVSLASSMGRWTNGAAPAEMYELAQRVKAIMEGLGSQRSAIARALDPWVAVSCRDLAGALPHPAVNEINARIEDIRHEMHVESQRRITAGQDPQAVLDAGNTQVRQLEAFRNERVAPLHRAPPGELSELFLRLAAEIVEVAPNTGPGVREKLLTFAPQVAELMSTYALRDPRPWIDEVDRLRPK